MYLISVTKRARRMYLVPNICNEALLANLQRSLLAKFLKQLKCTFSGTKRAVMSNLIPFYGALQNVPFR